MKFSISLNEQIFLQRHLEVLSELTRGLLGRMRSLSFYCIDRSSSSAVFSSDCRPPPASFWDAIHALLLFSDDMLSSSVLFSGWIRSLSVRFLVDRSWLTLSKSGNWSRSGLFVEESLKLQNILNDWLWRIHLWFGFSLFHFARVLRYFERFPSLKFMEIYCLSFCLLMIVPHYQFKNFTFLLFSFCHGHLILISRLGNILSF